MLNPPPSIPCRGLPSPDPIRAGRDRQLVIRYQAGFLVETFHITQDTALELIARHGVSRQKVLKAVEAEFGLQTMKARKRGRALRSS